MRTYLQFLTQKKNQIIEQVIKGRLWLDIN